MSQSAIKVVKPVDTNGQNRVSIAPIEDRAFWIEQRHALLMQLVSIERRLGLIHSRCPRCKTRQLEPIGNQG